MHPEADQWVSRYRSDESISVLDIGGRDINGTVRHLFPAAEYAVLDVRPGAGVDMVADAASWIPDRVYDMVICCEVFEHTSVWPQICATAYAALRPGGRFVATMAGPGRPGHSAVDGRHLRPGEHYANIHPDELRTALTTCGFIDILIDRRDSPADVRTAAIREA